MESSSSLRQRRRSESPDACIASSSTAYNSDDGEEEEASNSSSASSSNFIIPAVPQEKAVVDADNSSNGDAEEEDILLLPKKKPATTTRGHQTLKERSRIPPGMLVSFGFLWSLLYSTQFLGQLGYVITSYKTSVRRSMSGLMSSISRACSLFAPVSSSSEEGEGQGEDKESSSSSSMVFLVGGGGIQQIDRAWVIAVTLVSLSILYVLLYKPFRAGFWTGKRVSRHRLHRYMGLVFLLQYGVAWVEFATDYDFGGATTFMPIMVCLNGFIQATSAYFSFRVLPGLVDPGYYSDKAVLSRDFVLENQFFQLLSLFGAVYYNDFLRTNLQSSPLGQFTEIIFLFFPYVAIRPLYPTTRFMNAGTSSYGRSKGNERFYRVGTTMVKIFYLWAKYFLGFFVNWLIYMNKYTSEDMRLIRGLYLLNVGTVSIAVFLHTLRFLGVLPPKLTFSFYLAQIYLTFTALPYAYAMFTSHTSLAVLTFTGMVVNMARDRRLHGLWCLVAFGLIRGTDIAW